MNILVTGFEPNDDGLNASKILVESLRDEPPEGLSEVRESIHYEVMPPSSNKLQATILERILRYKPDYCVFIGQAPGRNKITFERLATNLKDFGSPDGDGNQPHGENSGCCIPSQSGRLTHSYVVRCTAITPGQFSTGTDGQFSTGTDGQFLTGSNTLDILELDDEGDT